MGNHTGSSPSSWNQKHHSGKTLCISFQHLKYNIECSLNLYIYKTEMSVCPSCLEDGWRRSWGGWTGKRGQWGGEISTRLEGGWGTGRVDRKEGNGEGDFTDGMPGWRYFSRTTPGHPACMIYFKHEVTQKDNISYYALRLSYRRIQKKIEKKNWCM